MRGQKSSRLVFQSLLRRAARAEEGRSLIVRSLKKNKNQTPARLTFWGGISPLKSFKHSSSRQLNLCPATGRSGGFYKLARLSRHALKKRGESGLLQNFKSKSW